MKDIKISAVSFVLLLNRASLGMLFILAGVRKLLPKEGSSVMENWHGFANHVASDAPLPEVLGKAYGYALPPVECLVGLALVIGLYTRLSSTLIALMLLSFIIAKGVMWWPATGPAFNTNIILLTLALLLAVLGSGAFAFKPDGLAK